MTLIKAGILIVVAALGMVAFVVFDIAEPRYFLYLMTGAPALVFLVMYLAEFRHVRFTRESGYVITLIFAIGFVALETGLRAIFFPEEKELGLFLFAATMVIAAGALWDLLFFLIKVKRDRKRLKLSRIVTDTNEPEGADDERRDS